MYAKCRVKDSTLEQSASRMSCVGPQLQCEGRSAVLSRGIIMAAFGSRVQAEEAIMCHNCWMGNGGVTSYGSRMQTEVAVKSKLRS